MQSSNGFDSVDQVARLYALDIIALISYDQVVYTDDMRSSLLYWTIVGAYFINGSKNDINTFVDVAVFDIDSHKLLFRAPGTNKVIAKSALINSSEKLRVARKKSFSSAIEDLTLNFDTELASFKTRINKDKSVEIAFRPGFSVSGGSMSWLASILLLCTLIKFATYIYTRKFYVIYSRKFWSYSPDPRFTK